MKRFIEREDRSQVLLPECLDDYVAEDNPVRVVDVFVDELDLGALGFEGVDPAATSTCATSAALRRTLSLGWSSSSFRASGPTR